MNLRGCKKNLDGYRNLYCMYSRLRLAHLISRFGYTRLAGAVGAAVKRAGLLYTMSDDPTSAVIADRRELVYRTLEAVERVRDASRDNFK